VKEIKLSKWWKTKSAKAAWGRAKARKRASLEKFLTTRKAKMEQLRKDVENWKVME
jgi:hypothetical protein